MGAVEGPKTSGGAQTDRSELNEAADGAVELVLEGWGEWAALEELELEDGADAKRALRIPSRAFGSLDGGAGCAGVIPNIGFGVVWCEAGGRPRFRIDGENADDD